MVNSMFKFARHGRSGAWVSELLPHITSIVDDICIVKTVNTEAINHDPAITFIQTGFQQPGRPCFGAWLAYGLGSSNENLPAFIVMISSGKESDQPLYQRLWSAGFMPSQFQGVQFRGGSDPVLFLSNPPGTTPSTRRRVLDALAALTQSSTRLTRIRKSTPASASMRCPSACKLQSRTWSIYRRSRIACWKCTAPM